jgi:NAD(P)-dependent dehydrogenase (short-subunit alcohol dehydrogenase family)
MLLNSDLVLDQARALAGRLYAGAKDRNDKPALVRSAYRLAFGRLPDPDETARGVAFLESQPALLSGRPTRLPMPNPDGIVPAQASALVDYCHALLNVNEFVFVD